MSTTDAAVLQALTDWRNGRAYIDGRGNYHVTTEGRRSGPVAPWNRAAKRAYPDVQELHRAAFKESTPMSTEVPCHEPVIAQLQERGIPAFEEASGGNNYHVSWPHPSGGYFLADANDGWWRLGVYVKPAVEDAWESWCFNPADMHDSELDEDAATEEVVAWLLEVAPPSTAGRVAAEQPLHAHCDEYIARLETENERLRGMLAAAREATR